MAKQLAREEGVLVGVSAAANVAAALRVAEEIAENQPEDLQDTVIVTILCDSADKYLSERFWDE